MKNTIQLSDFTFIPRGHGHFKVTYRSPVTGIRWWNITNDMPLIDATKGEDDPKKKDLEELKRLCKS